MGANSTQFTHGSTQADYLTRRIARDHPDILERMKAGEFSSVRQAALEAGIVQPLPLGGIVQNRSRCLRNRFGRSTAPESCRVVISQPRKRPAVGLCSRGYTFRCPIRSPIPIKKASASDAPAFAEHTIAAYKGWQAAFYPFQGAHYRRLQRVTGRASPFWRGKKATGSAPVAFDSHTISAYRKLAANRKRLENEDRDEEERNQLHRL